MDAFMFVVGAVACFVWRWMLWLQNQPAGVDKRGFWTDRKHIATNVCSAIVALFSTGLWITGMLTMAIDAAIPDNLLPPGSLKVAWYFSGPAGFFVTWATRRIVKWLNSNDGGENE